MAERLVLLDDDTGEIKDFIGEYRTQEQIEAQTKYVVNKEKQTFNSDFTWIVFEYGKELLPNIKDQSLVRLIYLSTICDYDGVLPPKSVIKKKLKLSDKYWSYFFKEMRSNNLILEDEETGALCLNKDFFIKGSLKEMSDKRDCTRLFCNFIQDVYDACDNIKSINQISYLYKLIPFVNRRTNIVCYNPKEQDPEKVYPITLGEFCDMIGYSRKNARRLVSDLLSLKCNGQNLIGFFVTNLNQTSWKIIVNPHIYYGGQNDKIYKEQIALLTDYNPQEAFDVNNT
nr:MAG TPA: Selenocysteine-specific elongation factor/RNA Complex, protein-rna complex, elongation factor [Caudoviricetes sp.]